ncbi:hypothetical protein Q3G72_007778 [Acer saccharum]|nr:hypothetical protein Q3G72_007778 [Acer saccharum]
MRRIPELVLVLASGEEVTSDSILGDRVESVDYVIPSSDNSKIREDMVWVTVDVKKRRDSDLAVADSEEDPVLSDNSESREEMVNSVVVDSEEDLVLASIIGGIKQARPNDGGNSPSFNFIGVDEEVLEEITRREEEDLACYEAMSALKIKNSKDII